MRLERMFKAQRGRENALCLIPEMKDHERGVELNREWCRERRHFDADRFDVVADLDRERRACDPKIPRELPHPCFYGVRRHDQVIDQGPGTERRDPGEFEREIWREALLLRSCQHGAVGVTWDPRVRILEVRAVAAWLQPATPRPCNPRRSRPSRKTRRSCAGSVIVDAATALAPVTRAVSELAGVVIVYSRLSRAPLCHPWTGSWR